MADQLTKLSISVVVPVFNGQQTIGETVEALLGQTLPPHEIIVVNDGSTDATLEVLKKYSARISLLSKPNGGPASARNAGVRAASGSLIAFTDSDCLPDKNWLRELVKGFYHPKVVGVGGIVRSADPGRLGEYLDINHFLDPGFRKGGIVLRLVTANACFRRDALLEAELFDERFPKPGGEDTEICIRLRSYGYELGYAAEALVLHHHKRTVPAFLRTVANYGEGLYISSQTWPEQEWKINHHREMIQSALALRSMLRQCLAYRSNYDLRRALLFSFLDHYRHAAYIWGYLRGKRRQHSTRPNSQNPRPAPTDLYEPMPVSEFSAIINKEFDIH